MSKYEHKVYRMQRIRKLLRKYLKMSDDQLTSWLLAKGLTNDREGCLEGIRMEFPWMLGTTIK